MKIIPQIKLEEFCPYGMDTESDLQVLLNECNRSRTPLDKDIIAKAFRYCVEAHKDVFRSSGSPYYVHPLKVAISLIREFSYADTASLVAALLHDVVEDVEEITHETIIEEFSSEIAEIVDGVTKIKGVKTRAMDKAATYGKLFMALVTDKRVLIIKLADRLDNMRTLSYLRPEKQKLIGHETLNFYTPIAQRLGLVRIKQELEDLSLFFTDRDNYERIRPKLEEKRVDFLSYIDKFHDQVQQKLNEREIPHVITIEHKHVYEIYKMLESGYELDAIDNFYSMVITLLTDDYAECYRAYGILANVFGPVSQLDDYIARPKINFYRALHSTHFGPDRKLVEVIIRTDEMDKIAEGGIAALAKDKEFQRSMEFSEEEISNWVNWMQSIMTEGDQDAIQKIWGSIRKNLYEEDIVVHTIQGVTYHIPKGGCLIDLAFMISTDTGIHCISAKVNGSIKELNYELKNHDKVELLTSANSKPSPEWQDWVVSQKAVVSLHNYFKANPVEEVQTPFNKRLPDIKLKIIGDDKPGMLNEITKAIDKANIQRINMFSADDVFEGLFTVHLVNNDQIKTLFTKLLGIPGVRGVERIEEGEE